MPEAASTPTASPASRAVWLAEACLPAGNPNVRRRRLPPRLRQQHRCQRRQQQQLLRLQVEG